MLFSRSRSLLFLALIAAPLAVATTGCSKAKPKPEMRLARTSTGIEMGDSSNAISAAPDATDTANASSHSWAPASGAPDETALNAAGSMDRTASADAASMANRAGNYGLDSTGSIPNSAGMEGLDAAVVSAELEMVHFEYDRSELNPDWQKILDGHAEWMQQNPKLSVQIEGHTDERGTEEYNMALGQRRADVVRTYLVEKGVDPNRLSTISYGKMRPMNFETDESSHALNRRAMFLVYEATGNSLASAGSAE